MSALDDVLRFCTGLVRNMRLPQWFGVPCISIRNFSSLKNRRHKDGGMRLEAVGTGRQEDDAGPIRLRGSDAAVVGRIRKEIGSRFAALGMGSVECIWFPECSVRRNVSLSRDMNNGRASLRFCGEPDLCGFSRVIRCVSLG